MTIESLSSLARTATAEVSAPPRAVARQEPTLVSTEVQPAAAVSTEQVQHAVETINRHLKAVAQNLVFSVDEDTGKTVVRVVDTATGELVRQVPSEELLAISRAIDRLQGLLLHQEA